MSFLYPRTVSFFRLPSQDASAGNAGYFGHARASEAAVLDLASGQVVASIACTIQCPSVGNLRTGDGKLPDDSAGPVRWNISFPAPSVAKGSVLTRDIAVDDEGNRYQVTAAYWSPLSWQIQTTRLEA